ncbi:hypothetical protein DFH11DRAFT_1580193 [Phellopilus nigrolimitatus]|nr:hypothetical protein DFH11DRAFT_1580193 [Phellopilus nigrolimitatus]
MFAQVSTRFLNHCHSFELKPSPPQNMQQSRSFGSSFKFPEGEAAAATGGPSGGNAAFGEDAQDDDLYA